MQTNYVVLLNDDGVSNINNQMAAHAEDLSRSLSSEQIRALAYVEGALEFGNAGDAAKEFSRLDVKTQQTAHGQALSRRINQSVDDSAWWKRVHAAMRAALGSKTKMSRSGNTVIFSEPQCGRHDLAGWRERAQVQLNSAGISVE